MFDLRKSLALALGVAAAVSGQATSAQETAAPSGSLLEEVVVTAQRREEKIQDVPIAISAFSEAQLQQLNVTQTLGLAKLIPNLLAFNNTGLGAANGYYLRGLGNTESIATFDPPVGTYIDDIFISRQNANNFSLLDMDRIEVLRGPQGTLFGRNTTGGAVNLIMKKPAKEFGGYAEAGFGQFGEVSGRASIDVPLSDTVLTKLSGYRTKNDGYVSNPVTGEDNLNYTKTAGVRGAVRFLFGEAVTWDVSVQFGKDEGENLLNFASGSSGRAYRFGNTANALVPIPAEGPQVDLVPQRAGLPPTSTAAQFIEARCRGLITKSRFYCTGLTRTGTPLAGLFTGRKQNLNLGDVSKNTLAASSLRWTTGLGELQFITGYNKLEQEYALDFYNGTAINTVAGNVAANPAGGYTLASIGDFKQLSQEIKLTGELNDDIRYVAGLYYFDERDTSDFGDYLGIGPSTGLVLEDRILKNKATAYAAYTQWDLKFAQAWTLTLGGRYTDETKKVDFIANANPRLAAPTAATRITSANMAALGIPLKLTTGMFTPRVALKFDLSSDVNFFVSATNGFKSGGWNARGTTPVANQPFSPEKVWSYEAGMRSDLLDRKVRLNVTAFRLDVKDLQTVSGFTNPANGSISFITRNFAGFQNDGVEAELIWAPVPAMNLFALVGVQNGKYKDIAPSILAQAASCRAAIAAGTSTANLCTSGIVNPSGNIADPVRTPDTLTLGASYALQIGANYTLTPNVVWARTGKSNVATNGAPAGLSDAYSTVDAGLTFASTSGNWQIRANCHNCTDELQVVQVLSDLPYVQAPRTWNISFRYNFGQR